MISTTVVLISTCVVAALLSTATAAPNQDVGKGHSSPCPSLFHYDSIDQPGNWVGTLQLLSVDDLHGLWIRLIFQNNVKNVTVDSDLDVVLSSGNNHEVLLKNRNVLLKSGAPKAVKITVTYEGTEFPELLGYRVNAKEVCPLANTKRTDFFSGDSNSKDFITSILSSSKLSTHQPEYECGRTLSSNSRTFPWQAGIFVTQGDNEQYVCEGTLISPSHLLTPAHCVTFKYSDLPISEHSILIYFSKSENPTKALIASVKVHPAYDPNTLNNDIAVLKLQSALTVNDRIRPICLNSEKGIGTDTLVGYNIEADGVVGDKLVEASIRKIEANDCVKQAPEFENILGDNTYCATYLPDNLSCAGDSGSSLVSYNDKEATLRGIVNVGITLQNKKECNDKSIVIVTDTSRYLKWIRHAL